MKKLHLVLLALGLAHALSAQTSLNMTLLANWDDPTLPVASPGNLNLQYSGCWGLAVNGHEYAILGGASDVLVFDVTDPTAPELREKFEGSQITVWREFKSYKNRVYCVSDNTSEGLMILDFSNAPNQIERVYWSNELFNAAHTITLDTVSGHVYLNGGSAGSGIIVLDVSQTPDEPTLLTQVPTLPGGYIHDSYVRNDTLYASSGYNGYWVYDFKTDVANPTALANIGTGGYNHNSWLTVDGRYAYYTEEIPRAQPIQIVDLQELTSSIPSLDLAGSFLDFLVPGGSEAISHNVYIRDTLLFNSQYEDGLLVYDISQPTAPVLVAHYDTHPQNTQYNGYFGNWGNYPWLPSGNIIAGDMQNGLYMLKLGPTSGTDQPAAVAAGIRVAPNPATDLLRIDVARPDQLGASWGYRLLDATGRSVRMAPNLTQNTLVLDVAPLVAGLYVVEIRGANGAISVQKVLIEK
jgi:choice-of-anchor B domain-containing protein